MTILAIAICLMKWKYLVFPMTTLIYHIWPHYCCLSLVCKIHDSFLVKEIYLQILSRVFLQIEVAKFVMTIKHLIIATQLVICLNKGQNIEILWNKLIIVILVYLFYITHLNIVSSSRHANRYVQWLIFDILPTFSLAQTIALHTFFSFDIMKVIFVKEGGKDRQYLTVFSLIYIF